MDKASFAPVPLHILQKMIFLKFIDFLEPLIDSKKLISIFFIFYFFILFYLFFSLTLINFIFIKISHQFLYLNHHHFLYLNHLETHLNLQNFIYYQHIV